MKSCYSDSESESESDRPMNTTGAISGQLTLNVVLLIWCKLHRLTNIRKKYVVPLSIAPTSTPFHSMISE